MQFGINFSDLTFFFVSLHRARLGHSFCQETGRRWKDKETYCKGFLKIFQHWAFWIEKSLLTLSWAMNINHTLQFIFYITFMKLSVNYVIDKPGGKVVWKLGKLLSIFL